MYFFKLYLNFNVYFQKLILILAAFGILLELNLDTVYLFQIDFCLGRITKHYTESWNIVACTVS